MINVAISGDKAARGALDAVPAAANRVMLRELTKAARWVSDQGSREIASAAEIPVRSYNRGRSVGRVRMSLPKNGSTLSASVWFGMADMKAAYVGAMSQAPSGAQAGSHFFQGAFVAKMTSGHVGVYLRSGKERFPIKEQSVEIAAPSSSVLSRIEDEASSMLNDGVIAGLAGELQIG